MGLENTKNARVLKHNVIAYFEVVRQVIAIVVCLSICGNSHSQGFHNLDLEVMDDENPLPKNWYLIDEYETVVEVDSRAYSGKKCFFLYPAKLQSVGSIIFINELDRSLYRNKRQLIINAHVKSSGSNSKISIVTRQLTESGQEIVQPFVTHSLDDSRKEKWTMVTYEQDIDSVAMHIAFGVSCTVKDSVWIDAFEITIDGTQIHDDSPRDNLRPSDKQLRWLKKACITVDTSSSDKIKFLSEIASGTNVVALGEVTHGSNEIYHIKDLMIRYLVEHEGYSILAMEMDLAEAELLNKYVLTGQGDPRELLMRISYWPWRTEEFLTLLNWMNAFNRTHTQKVEITGFDIPISNLAIDSVVAFGSKDDGKLFEILSILKTHYEQGYRDNSKKIERFIERVQAVLGYLDANEEEIIRASNSEEYERFRYKVRSLKQTAVYYLKTTTGNSSFRDECMSDNASWLIERNPSTKIVIWAHNAHISKGKDDYGAGMGNVLKQKHNFYSIGFSLGTGSFTAINEQKTLSALTLKYPIQDSYELFFIQGGQNVCFLNLNGLRRNRKNDWLFASRKLRYIGAVVVPRYQFALTSLMDNFDGIVFIPTSTPSHPLTW